MFNQENVFFFLERYKLFYRTIKLCNGIIQFQFIFI